MPQPSTAVQRPELAAIASEVMADAGKKGFIGLRVLPTFNTAIKTGEYPVITRESMMKLPETARAPRAKYPRGDWTFDLDNFSCKESAWEEPYDDVEAKLYKNLFDYHKMCTIRGANIVLRRLEKTIADAVFNTSTFTPVSITNEWDDAANATPITDIQTGKIAGKDATGVDLDTLIIAYSTVLNLGINAQILDRIKYTHPGVVSGELTIPILAAVLGVNQILVGDAYYDSADAGQSASMSGLWSNEYAMLCRTSDSDDLYDPALGRTFMWGEESGEGEAGLIVEEYRDETVRGTVIRTRHSNAPKLVCTDVGYLMDNVTT